jgi:Putative beta-barrel porin-2, OmpL-like. bbp2
MTFETDSKRNWLMFKRCPKAKKSVLSSTGLACALLNVGAWLALADDTNGSSVHEQSANATTAAPSTPAMAGPLTPNPSPTRYDTGPFGNVFATGALTGFALWQNNPTLGDRGARVDLTNAQVFVQKADGILQFFVQGGLYALPAIGTPYINSIKTTNDLWGPIPQVFIKLAPNDNWSVMVGKLPSLVGLEYTFSFQNLNIERGLLWNQTSSVSRGVQLNHSVGPISLALSWNDGFYSDQLSWLSGSATWKIDSAHSLAAIWAGNVRTTTVSTTATPLFQNNSRIYNVIYTNNYGPWTLSPYLQYTYIPRRPSIGVLHDAATYGAALLMNYAFDSSSKVGGLSLAGFSLPFRIEYIASTGNVANGAPNLMYGPGSTAWSIAITPTYQYKRFFARAEFSYVGASNTTAGFAFGPTGANTRQARLLLESGFLF